MDDQRDFAHILEEGASIRLVVFKIVIGVFFGLALVSVITRAAARLYLRRHLSLDDHFLFAAALFLSGSIGLTYVLSEELYLWMALRKDMSLVFRLDPYEMTKALETSLGKIDAFLITAWTAIFLVKGSFLAFFKQLIWQVDMIQRYFWIVVGINVLSWMFLILEPFILCRDFGLASVKCMDNSKNKLYIVLTGLITALDALTDLLIVSIPVILLGRSSLRLSQKVALGTFMSLSLVMVAIAIVRCSNIYGKDGVDLPWEFFWQAMEANIGVLMGSLTVFRTLLTHDSKKRLDEQRRVKAAGPRSNIKSSLSLRVWRLLNMKGRPNDDLETQEVRGQPDIPSATLTGLRTFIRRNNRDEGQTLASDTVAKTSQTVTMAGDDEATSEYKEDGLLKLDSTHRAWGSQDSANLTLDLFDSQTQTSASSTDNGLPRFGRTDHRSNRG